MPPQPDSASEAPGTTRSPCPASGARRCHARHRLRLSLCCTIFVDHLTQVGPGVRFERARTVWVSDAQIAHTVRGNRFIFGKDVPKSLLDHRTQGAAPGLGMSLCTCQQLIMNIDCGLHRPILPLLLDMVNPASRPPADSLVGVLVEGLQIADDTPVEEGSVGVGVGVDGAAQSRLSIWSSAHWTIFSASRSADWYSPR